MKKQYTLALTGYKTDIPVSDPARGGELVKVDRIVNGWQATYEVEVSHLDFDDLRRAADEVAMSLSYLEARSQNSVMSEEWRVKIERQANIIVHSSQILFDKWRELQSGITATIEEIEGDLDPISADVHTYNNTLRIIQNRLRELLDESID